MITQNIKNKKDDPTIVVNMDGSEVMAREVVIYGEDGLEAARILFAKQRDPKVNARVWIEPKHSIKVIH